MTTTEPEWRTYPRDTLDMTGLRPVASVIMDGGRDEPIVVYTNEPADRFWLDTPGLPVITVHTTIRRAIRLALRNGGWG